MVNQELIDYLKKGVSNGFSLIELKNKLIIEEWSEKEIDEAIEYTKNIIATYKEPPKKYYTKFIVIGVSLVFLLVLFIIFATMSQIAKNTISSEELESGIAIEIKNVALKVEYKDNMVEKIKLIKTMPYVVDLYVGKNNTRIYKARPMILDLGNDGEMDIKITYQSSEKGIATLFIESYKE